MSTARHVTSTAPDLRTVCMVCGLVLVEGRGPEDEKVSHGLCDHLDCLEVTIEPIDDVTIMRLARASEIAYGRFMTAPGERDDEPAQRALEVWDRAHRRLKVAVEHALGPQRGHEMTDTEGAR